VDGVVVGGFVGGFVGGLVGLVAALAISVLIIFRREIAKIYPLGTFALGAVFPLGCGAALASTVTEFSDVRPLFNGIAVATVLIVGIVSMSHRVRWHHRPAKLATVPMMLTWVFGLPLVFSLDDDTPSTAMVRGMFFGVNQIIACLLVACDAREIFTPWHVPDDQGPQPQAPSGEVQDVESQDQDEPCDGESYVRELFEEHAFAALDLTGGATVLMVNTVCVLSLLL